MNNIFEQTRGIRNNNPMNIRVSKANNWVGKIKKGKKDPQFEEFTDMMYGVRAAIRIIRNYVRMYGIDNIKELIERWAPEEDGNDTLAYIQYVVKVIKMNFKMLGDEKRADSITLYSPVDINDFFFMKALIMAMCKLESRYVMDDETFIRAWKAVMKKH